MLRLMTHYARSPIAPIDKGCTESGKSDRGENHSNVRDHHYKFTNSIPRSPHPSQTTPQPRLTMSEQKSAMQESTVESNDSGDMSASFSSVKAKDINSHTAETAATSTKGAGTEDDLQQRFSHMEIKSSLSYRKTSSGGSTSGGSNRVQKDIKMRRRSSSGRELPKKEKTRSAGGTKPGQSLQSNQYQPLSLDGYPTTEPDQMDVDPVFKEDKEQVP